MSYEKKEIWKDVVGYEGLYKVSSHGRVKSLRNGKLLRQASSKRYKTVQLHNKGGKCFYVHRLVGEAFIKNPDNLPEINHINHIRECNYVDNLEWCTKLYNIYDGSRFKKFQKYYIKNNC